MLHVVHGPDGPEAGGTERYAAELARAQTALGAEARTWWGHGVRRRCGMFGDVDNGDAVGALAAELVARPVDVVHVHHLTGLSAALPTVARAHGPRVVLTLHDAWMGCARGQLVDHAGQRCAGPTTERCARCLAPDRWAPLPARLARRLPAPTAAVTRRADAMRGALAACDLVLAPAPHLPEQLDIAATVLPLPLLGSIQPAAARDDGAVRFLFLGALLPTKGIDVAVDGFLARRTTAQATLTVAGPAQPWRGSLRHVDTLLARIDGEGDVRHIGPVAREALQALFDTHDVLLFPSTWEENSPLVAMEASAAGLVILASDVPGVRHTAPRATRLPVADRAAWSRAIDAEIRAGRRRVAPVTFPTMDAHAGDLLARYRSLAGGGGLR